ncbi:uncharacterized protein PpBr36_09160 [Pyricularia pennisetigena]|uniref:uncharacterized protein n=1 Tax=Pyricularia pennisetigena TaxID=1578925 RepID=UPI001153873B|nr:uncharacterized protein PpBr36_09160 [Pyricularia pennisetigena]TLS21739.1 hypothetical protein PpBr36_09160 [Pyricularia pennisetigena]
MHALAGVRKRKGPRPIDLGYILLLLASPARGDQGHSEVRVTTSIIVTQTITTHLGARPTQPPNHAGYGLQGCYRRPEGDADVGLEVKMPLSNAEAGRLTTSKCLEACIRASLGRGAVDSYGFVALGEGRCGWPYDKRTKQSSLVLLDRECYCATKLSPEVLSVGPGNCSTPCAGDHDIACGGLDHISVYYLVDSAAAARYATQGLGTGDPGSPASLDSGKNGGKAAAVAMGSLAGCATFGLLVFLGCKLYRRRGDLASGRSRSRVAKATEEKDKHGNGDGVLVISAPESDETRPGPQRSRPGPPPPLPPLAGLDNHSGQQTGRRGEIMRVQFVHSPHPRSEQGATGGSSAYQQPSAAVPASPLSPADDGLRQRRRSSSKPVDWARFDAVIPNGQFSPTTSPTKDRFLSERPRRASMTVYYSNHGTGSATYPSTSSESIGANSAMHPSKSRSSVGGGNEGRDAARSQPQRPDQIRVSAWSASTAEPSPQSTTTVGSSILDASPSSPCTARRLNPGQMTAPAPAATGGLGDRAWSRRRLSTPFLPPGGGSPTSSHSGGSSRRSSLADIVGDYHGVRVGRVEQQLQEKKDEEEKEEQQQQQQQKQRDDLMPSPLHLIKWKKSFVDMRRAGSGAYDGNDDVEDSPVLPVWDAARTTPKVEELSPRESSKGKFEDEVAGSPMSIQVTKGFGKGGGEQDKSRGDAGKAAPVAEELLILPATTYDGGRVLATARNKKMV